MIEARLRSTKLPVQTFVGFGIFYAITSYESKQNLSEKLVLALFGVTTCDPRAYAWGSAIEFRESSEDVFQFNSRHQVQLHIEDKQRYDAVTWLVIYFVTVEHFRKDIGPGADSECFYHANGLTGNVRHAQKRVWRVQGV
jgi:hypothetical protein